MAQTASSASTICQTAGLDGTDGRKSASIGIDASSTATMEMVSGGTARHPNSAAVSEVSRSTSAR